MARHTQGGRLDATGRWDADWLPKPRKDIGYYFDLPEEADRIRRKLDRTQTPARLLRKIEWPTRKPALKRAQVGDAVVGNVELRAACACGHSSKVEASVVAAKFDLSTRIADIENKVRCTQCRRYGVLTPSYPPPHR